MRNLLSYNRTFYLLSVIEIFERKKKNFLRGIVQRRLAVNKNFKFISCIRCNLILFSCFPVAVTDEYTRAPVFKTYRRKSFPTSM